MKTTTVLKRIDWKRYLLPGLMAISFLSPSCKQEEANRLNIKVKFDEAVFQRELNGKLILLFDQDTASPLLYWVNPFNPHPVFTYDLHDWNPKDTLVIDHFSEEWYREYAQLEGEYAFRVIFDCDSIERSSLNARGNGYSDKQKTVFVQSEINSLEVGINKVFNGWIFNGSEIIKEERLVSKNLSHFWGFDMYIESAVILPENYGTSQKEYPIVYVFPGFGSNHASVTYGTGQIDRYGMNQVGEDKIFVFMNAEFFQGYHHFADSENNGPWGRAFTEEFLPYIENKYRVSKDPEKRFLMGQSSGGWTAVWLQVNYPDLFAGAFASSPDPLDFRAFAFNIYLPDANYYFPPEPDSAAIQEGNRKKLYAELEHVLGEFGQVRTWEATYSPRNQDGSIAILFDRSSGNIDPHIASYWQNYDISKIISEDPLRYRDLLSGKLHIFVAEDDPYDLNKSVEMIEMVLKEQEIEADIQYFNGLGHNVWTDELREHIHSIIDKQ